jgi:integrase
MKSGRPHRVPLSGQVIKLLQDLPKFAGTELLFPGRNGIRPLSDMALTQIMRRMDYRDKSGEICVPHGCRSTFSDWTAERTSYQADVREMALAHAIGNDTVGAYRRGDLFDKRRNLMNDWTNFLDAPPVTSDNVIPIRTAA